MKGSRPNILIKNRGISTKLNTSAPVIDVGKGKGEKGTCLASIGESQRKRVRGNKSDSKRGN